MTDSKGLSIIEIIVAMAIFLIIATSSSGFIISSLSLGRQSYEQNQAKLLAQECIEASYSLKNQGWLSPFLATDCSLGCGLDKSAGFWQYSGTSDQIDSKYTRQIFVNSVNRDTAGNIVESGGVEDPDTKKITCQVDWLFTDSRPNQVQLTAYHTTWSQTTPAPTQTPTATPTPVNCNQYCQQVYSLSGSCLKSNQCSGQNEGRIYECSSPNICCCQ